MTPTRWDRPRRVALGLFLLMILAPLSGGGVAGQAVSEGRDPTGPVTDRVVTVTAFIEASPMEAFRFFTDRDLLESWLAPEADIEVRVGGKYELFWQPEDRANNSTIGCRITALFPGQYLAFQWRSPEQYKPFANTADPLTHVVVAFVPEGSGTRVHLIHSGWRSEDRWEAARLWQEQAWTSAFRQLQHVSAR